MATCYPSDLTDREWEILRPLLPPMAAATAAGGRPEKWDRRTVINAIRYITDNGAKWRALPRDFGIPWQTVYSYFARWSRAGVTEQIRDELRRMIRIRSKRPMNAVALVVDSQSVKASETVSKATRGWDGGKAINGRKRHICVDRGGLLVDVLVTPADCGDRDAAQFMLKRLHDAHPEIVVVYADSGYSGELVEWALDELGITLIIVKRPRNAKGWILLPTRWVVERTFGWIMRARRNVRDHERLMAHSEAHINWTAITLMTRRLSRPRNATHQPGLGQQRLGLSAASSAAISNTVPSPPRLSGVLATHPGV
jgi:transposase